MAGNTTAIVLCVGDFVNCEAEEQSSQLEQRRESNAQTQITCLARTE